MKRGGGEMKINFLYSHVIHMAEKPSKEGSFMILEGFVGEYYHFVALCRLRLILSSIALHQVLTFAIVGLLGRILRQDRGVFLFLHYTTDPVRIHCEAVEFRV